MHLTLSPQQGLPGQPEMEIHVTGEVITIDGVPYDLSSVPEGGEGELDDTPISGPVTRTGGVLHVTVRARMGDTAAPEQGGPWGIENASGAVTIPAARKEATHAD